MKGVKKMKQLNNKELLELIKTDVEKFNNYRAEYPNQKIDFSGANLQQTYFEWANLAEANIQDADLEMANLEGTNLQGANLQGANLLWANLQGANLQGACLKLVKITLTKENIEAIKGALF